MIKNFVMFLTLFRIFAGLFIFLLVFAFDAYLLALLIFFVASLSDYLDGNLARRYNVESALGATLDPIADKILVLFALFTITLITKDPFIGGMSAVILAREFWVSALREHAAQHSLTEATKVTYLAKIKTTIQFISIISFLLAFEINLKLLEFVASFLLFMSMLVSLKTGLEYSKNTFIDTK
jgi:CDP-diacylglycerol--glycerol-3-phosphate 3-phosphatidyltransferase